MNNKPDKPYNYSYSITAEKLEEVIKNSYFFLARNFIEDPETLLKNKSKLREDYYKFMDSLTSELFEISGYINNRVAMSKPFVKLNYTGYDNELMEIRDTLIHKIGIMHEIKNEIDIKISDRINKQLVKASNKLAKVNTCIAILGVIIAVYFGYMQLRNANSIEIKVVSAISGVTVEETHNDVNKQKIKVLMPNIPDSLSTEENKSVYLNKGPSNKNKIFNDLKAASSSVNILGEH